MVRLFENLLGKVSGGAKDGSEIHWFLVPAIIWLSRFSPDQEPLWAFTEERAAHLRCWCNFFFLLVWLEVWHLLDFRKQWGVGCVFLLPNVVYLWVPPSSSNWGTPSGLMVSVLGPRSSSLSWIPSWGHCVVCPEPVCTFEGEQCVVSDLLNSGFLKPWADNWNQKFFPLWIYFTKYTCTTILSPIVHTPHFSNQFKFPLEVEDCTLNVIILLLISRS